MIDTQVVIINGTARSGKDTFCNYSQMFASVYTYSSVSYIKHIARMLGWDGKKDERARRFLSDLKDLVTDFSDLPMRKMEEVVTRERGNTDIIYLMIREPKEIERAKNRFNAVTLLLKRPHNESITSNHADAEVDDYDYDYTVINNGTLEDLMRQAEVFVRMVKNHHFEYMHEVGK